MTNKQLVCKNCETVYTGNFCPHCGQSADVGRLDKKYLLKDLMKLFGNTESGKYFLIKELFRDPGSAARGYIAGQRKKYYNPVGFYLYTTAAILFVTFKLNISESFVTGESSAELELNRKFISFLYKYFNAVEFAVLPLFTFYSYLLFKKAGYNYSELFVLNTYSSAQRQLVSLIFLFLIFFIPSSSGLINILSIVTNSALLLWFYLSFFKDQPKVTVTVKTLVLILFYYISAMAIIYSAYNIFLMTN